MVHTFFSANELTLALAEEFRKHITELNRQKRPLSLAISGGSTPITFFDMLSARKKEIEWKYLHFFWVDERCVPPDHPESNYGMTRQHLLQSLDLSENQVHRIFGEEDPALAATRYQGDLNQFFAGTVTPEFDWIFLGMGEDGHTASIFPGQTDLFSSNALCSVSQHPSTGQKRITLTGRVINSARRTTFMVTGQNKSHIIAAILNHQPEASKFPAYYVKPLYAIPEWYLDEPAASQLNQT
jgi:6-phosphogluconolactonase